MKCKYGCNQEAKFILVNGKGCCSKSPNSCGGMKLKNKQGLKRKRKNGWNPGYNFKNENEIWNKGLSANNDKRVKKGKETLIFRYKNGTLIPSFLGKFHKEKSKKIISTKLKKFYKDPEGRKRLRDIGRKGGFGKKGITEKGTRYESLIEKEIFEYLENKNILFEAHKHIPNSSKISDVYLIEKDLWIEIDGINREKRKKWLGKNYEYWLDKLKIYKKQNLNYKIIYNKKDIAQLV